ncbi:MAG: hypothetical protein WCJ40_15740 [Planctomycetota bacterium]
MIADLPNTEQRRVSETRALVFITLLSGALCSMIAFYFSDRTPYLGYHDSPDYMRMAENFINHQVLSLESHAEGKPFYPTIARMPGYPVLLGLINLAFGRSEWNIPVLNLTSYLMSCLIISIMAHRLFGFIPAVMTSILTTSHFSSIYYTLTGMSESSANFIVVGLIFIYQIFKGSHGIKALAMIGMATGVAGLYREPLLPVLMIGFVTFGLDWNFSFRRNVRKVALFVAFALTAYSPWIYRNYRLSNQFIPVTIYGKGTNGIRLFQDLDRISLMLDLTDWKKIGQLEFALLNIINEKIGYRYHVLFGNRENQVIIKDTDLVSDIEKYFPDELYETLANGPDLAPTIKCEILFRRYMSNVTKPLEANVLLSHKAKKTVKRLGHLYSCNDMSNYSSFRYGYYSHKFMQIRWYLFECPLALIGLIYGLRNKNTMPFLAFILLYTTLFMVKMHIEPRYGYLPILFIKIFTGYGLYRLTMVLKSQRNVLYPVSQS